MLFKRKTVEYQYYLYSYKVLFSSGKIGVYHNESYTLDSFRTVSEEICKEGMFTNNKEFSSPNSIDKIIILDCKTVKIRFPKYKGIVPKFIHKEDICEYDVID